MHTISNHPLRSGFFPWLLAVLICAAVLVSAGTAPTAQAAQAAQAAKKAISLARIPHIHVMVIDPLDPEKLLIATTRGLYRVGRDGKMQTLLDKSHEVAGFVISADGQRLLASGKKNGKGMGIRQSTNGGLSWYQRGIDPTPKFAMRSLVNTDAYLKRLYAVGKVLARSSDGGRSWRQIGPLPSGLIGLTAPGPEDTNLLAATAKGVQRSSNGGVEWYPVKVGTEGRPASMIVRGIKGDVFTFIVKDGLYVRRGGSTTWRKLAGMEAFDGALINLASGGKSRRRMIVLTQFSKILESTDGGKSWKKFRR